MTDRDFDRKQAELDRLLNDPATPMSADRIWALLEDLAKRWRDAEPLAA